MSLWPKSTFWRIALIVLWVAAAVAGAWSSHGRIHACEYDPQTQQNSCAVYNVVLGSLWHVGKFFDDWQASFIVFGTLAVAGFTWALWYTTVKLWEATKATADAAEKSATVAAVSLLPVVRIAGIEIDDWKEVTIEVTHYRQTFPTVIVLNHGNSAATVTKFATGFGVGKPVPPYPSPITEWKIKQGLFIAVNDDLRFEGRGLNLLLTDEQWQKISSEEWRLRCWDVLCYRDIFGEETEIGFLWRYLPEGTKLGGPARFIERAHPDYTYHRKIS